MWTQQQQQNYLRGLPSQHPQQQTLHPGIIGTDDRTHHHHHHGSTTTDSSGSSNPRASRNMAEKQRRDNINVNISSLWDLILPPGGSSRRMDRLSILRLSNNYLRKYFAFGPPSTPFLPQEFNDFDMEQLVDTCTGGGAFLIVLTTKGKIVCVSRQVEKYVGHAQIDLEGHSLYNFIHREDHEELTRNLTPHEAQVSSTTAQITEAVDDNNSNSSEDSSSLRNERGPFRNQRRSFKLRMSQRTASKREHMQYETLHISGILKLAYGCSDPETNASRARLREISPTSNDIIFVGIARTPEKRLTTELTIMDARKDEYCTRHLLDGRIIFCDHRVSPVAGYLSEEVSGLSAFTFMHKNDFRWTMIGLRQMYDQYETYGSSCYRLVSKTGNFIYLCTHGYLETDKNTRTVESFLCINTLLSEEEGEPLIREMKKRFSATVSGSTRAMIPDGDDTSFDLSSDSQLSNSQLSSVEDPKQIEAAIKDFVTNLPSPAVAKDRLSPSPSPNAKFAEAASLSQSLPPAATQANMIGIMKIDRYLVFQGKGNRTPDQEPKASPRAIEYPMSDRQIMMGESPQLMETPLPMPVLVNQMRNMHDGPQHETKPGQSPESFGIIQCDPSTYESTGTSSDSESNSHYKRKRLYSDEDNQSIRSKKMRSEPLYALVDGDEQQGTSYLSTAALSSRSFGSEEESNINSQSLKMEKSPNSSLHDSMNLDYQQFADLQDFKNEGLLSPGLDENPDSLNTAKLKQLRDGNQDVIHRIQLFHLRIEESIALRNSEMNNFEQDLQNTNCQAPREKLTKYQAEQKMQKQYLKTLQQELHNVDVNVKHNIGV